MPYSKTIGELRTNLGCVYRGGDSTSARLVTGVTTDSRTLNPGMLFVARRGEQLDGHDFIEEACLKGASAVCLEANWVETHQVDLEHLILRFSSVGYLILSDTTLALGSIARSYRDELTFPVICITGSNGKTSTKELIRALLTRLVGPGTWSEKSFNNHVGLPDTILRANTTDRWLVLEAGMNHPGELDYLGSVAKPDIAVVLNVGPVHLEYFSSVESIADAKCELLRHVRRGGSRVINGDDPILRLAVDRIEKDSAVETKRKTFGISLAADCFATAIVAKGALGSEFDLHCGEETVKVKLPLPGNHHILNTLASVLIAREAFPALSLQEIRSVLGEAEAAPMRFEISSVGKIKIINDAYNANPVSMRMGLLTLNQISSEEKVGVVLGDMLELGRESEKFHRELGTFLATLNISRLVAVGEYSQTVVKGAKDGGLSDAVSCRDTDEATKMVLSWLKQGITTIYFKASRRIGLERIVKRLVQELSAQN